VSGLGRPRTPHLRAGVIAAIAALVIDQASKLWLLYVFDIATRGAVRVTPFFDLVLAWNVGISFGWFQTDNQLAQVALMAINVLVSFFAGLMPIPGGVGVTEGGQVVVEVEHLKLVTPYITNDVENPKEFPKIQNGLRQIIEHFERMAGIARHNLFDRVASDPGYQELAERRLADARLG
jgi:hypothetical protein